MARSAKKLLKTPIKTLKKYTKLAPVVKGKIISRRRTIFVVLTSFCEVFFVIKVKLVRRPDIVSVPREMLFAPSTGIREVVFDDLT